MEGPEGVKMDEHFTSLGWMGITVSRGVTRGQDTFLGHMLIKYKKRY